MSEIVVFGRKLIQDESRIARVLNLSDTITDRMRVVFENGYELSIIRPAGGGDREIGRSLAYGGGGLYEIAVFTPAGEFTQEFFPQEEYMEDVLGWQSPEQVSEIAEKVSSK